MPACSLAPLFLLPLTVLGVGEVVTCSVSSFFHLDEESIRWHTALCGDNQHRGILKHP